jgi:hypothetical protein
MTPALKKKTLHVQGSGEWAFVGVAGLALVCLRQTPLILFGGKLKAHSPEPPCGGLFFFMSDFLVRAHDASPKKENPACAGFR